jgi:hypothetical protein
MKKHSIREILGKIILILLGLLVALVLVELAARQLLKPPYAILAKGKFDVQCDRLVGWRGIPYYSKIKNTEGYAHQVVLNSRGMHDGEHPFEKEDGVFRVLMIGDSFVEVEQVNEAQTNHQVLEDVLNSRIASNYKVEVISAGVGGWGPAQELMYYRSEGQSYKADLVIVMGFLANDLLDNLPDYRRTSRDGINCYAPYFTICDGKFDPQPWFSAPGLQPTWRHCPFGKKSVTTILNWLYANSRIYQILEPTLTKGQEQLVYEPPYAPWLETKAADEILNYAYQLNVEIYARLANEASDSGAKVLFVLVPLREAVIKDANPDFENLPLVKEADLEHINATLPNQTMTQLMAARQLSILDLQPYFVDYVKAGNELPYGKSGDFHWNVQGNQLAAQIIADWLIAHKDLYLRSKGQLITAQR